MGTEAESLPFLAGVVEGFYGRPWTRAQRLILFERLADWSFNAYCYAPKDDLKHRALWRELYDGGEADELGATVRSCQEHGIRFVYGLAPGLDVRYSDAEERRRIEARLEQLVGLGVRDFALLFDDIPDAMEEADRRAFGTFAAAHAALANEVLTWLRRRTGDGGLLFCPTPYCGRMDREELGGSGYLDELGAALDPAIGVFWTGPEIISRTISAEHLDAMSARLRRRPVLWDNLHANDYDLRRLFVGPYCGRPDAPQERLAGIFLNPNCEFEANFVPLLTLSRYLAGRAAEPPRARYREAIAAWLPSFRGAGAEWTLEDVTLLGDVFYLPHEDGELAGELASDAAFLAGNPPERWDDREERFRRRARQIQAISAKLTELANRDLFYTFNRQWWELREEVQLLVRFLDWRKERAGPRGAPFTSPEHLPGTYRGGVVRRLQGLLRMTEEGTFEAS